MKSRENLERIFAAAGGNGPHQFEQTAICPDCKTNTGRKVGSFNHYRCTQCGSAFKANELVQS